MTSPRIAASSVVYSMIDTSTSDVEADVSSSVHDGVVPQPIIAHSRRCPTATMARALPTIPPRQPHDLPTSATAGDVNQQQVPVYIEVLPDDEDQE